MSDGPMSPGGPVRPNPGGARWCEEHQRFECTKQRTKQRGDCHNAAISGTNVCRNHGGQSLEVLKARGEANKAAVTAFSALGALPSLDPGFAVLASLQMSWLRVHLYARLLEEQIEHDAEATHIATPLAGPVLTKGYADTQPSPDGVAGLIGHTYSADKMAGIFASGEAVRALVTLEAQERDRAVRFAKVAHDMGIAEREVRLAESQGQLLAAVVKNILGDLDLTPEQQAVAPAAIQRRFREAAVGELESAGGAA